MSMSEVTSRVVAGGYRIFEDSIEGKEDLLLPLLAAHREELATDKRLMRFAPDFALHVRMQSEGALMVLFAYHGEQMVGYSSSLIFMHHHYPDLKCASNDLLYVAPEHRNSGLGMALIRRTKERARELGVKFMTWHAKPATALTELLPRLGCRVQDIIYSEEL
jgi:predicted GNAT superfamily acetyltransferase